MMRTKLQKKKKKVNFASFFFLKHPEGTSGGVPGVGAPGVVQLLQHPGVLHGIVGVVGLSQEVSDHVLLRITAQTEEILAQQEGVEKPGHHLLELPPEGELPQHPGQHRCVEPLCIVGRQHHGAGEGAQEGDEGGENFIQGDGVHELPAAKQDAIADGEAGDVCGALGEGEPGDGEGVEDPLSTDGRQLDDVTHRGV